MSVSDSLLFFNEKGYIGCFYGVSKMIDSFVTGRYKVAVKIVRRPRAAGLSENLVGSYGRGGGLRIIGEITDFRR